MSEEQVEQIVLTMLRDGSCDELIKERFYQIIMSGKVGMLEEYLSSCSISNFIWKIPKDCYNDYVSWCTSKGLLAAPKDRFDSLIDDKYSLASKVVCNNRTTNKSRRVYAPKPVRLEK